MENIALPPVFLNQPKGVTEILKYRYGVIHGLATCDDCDWQTASYKNAQAISKIHAQRYKHRVTGELGIAFEYDGRD